mmetsp:Transcript_9381/g.20338  ORF Transcript_9381/g.20338 Transcript_9381/m.20338 type:complete len:218 (+) Transcript_9381:811-1464(+)
MQISETILTRIVSLYTKTLRVISPVEGRAAHEGSLPPLRLVRAASAFFDQERHEVEAAAPRRPVQDGGPVAIEGALRTKSSLDQVDEIVQVARLDRFESIHFLRGTPVATAIRTRDIVMRFLRLELRSHRRRLQNVAARFAKRHDGQRVRRPRRIPRRRGVLDAVGREHVPPESLRAPEPLDAFGTGEASRREEPFGSDVGYQANDPRVRRSDVGKG